MSTYASLRGPIARIAREAGRIILQKSALRVEQKEGHANFVTNVDRAVQDHLAGALAALLPGSRFIGEEQENEALTDQMTWVIDPVDGTTNLIHDCRFSAVSIALLEGGQPVVGAVYQPYTDELFYAEAGCGATLNGSPIHTADHPFERALVAFGTSPYNASLAKKSMEIALACLQSAADIRRSGSAALDLAYVACGRIDAFFELQLKPWDFAAGALLVTEAGGSLRMPLIGDDVRFDAPQGILAASAVCDAEMLALFRAHTA